MKAVVLAYHDVGCAGIEALLRNGFDVVAVFTHRDDPVENTWFGSVARLAASHRIPVFAPEDINHPIWVGKLRSLEPDFIFSFYYRKMVQSEILAIPKSGCLNLHGSLLPGYRGRCPVNWVLIHGERETGVTLHHMTDRADAGDIVGQRKIAISDDDTARSLHEKLTHATAELLDDVLPHLKNGTAPRRTQDHSKATYFGGRRAEDGEIDWRETPTEVRNLVRAVTHPYPGAFSCAGERKCFVWAVSVNDDGGTSEKPGTVVSVDPLVVACGGGSVKVDFGQVEDGVYMTGSQLARELHLTPGITFGRSMSSISREGTRKKVLILGVDGFIGSALGERLLETDKHEVHGMDLQSNYVERLVNRPGFHFTEGDISIHREWIEYHIRKCDIVLPLVAIATPAEYTRNPLRVFELDFEENLRVVRYCVKYGKRVVFPSSSEVYGMCTEDEFDEDNSNLVLGPIRMQRWIYSCSKQLLDRVIWAYGQQEGLKFTLFRPFNWIGPRLDSLESARIGSSRAITQLILNLVEGTPVRLVDGGEQKRCFTDVRDGIEGLLRIIENKNDVCDGRIINLGNPDNEISIKDLGRMLVDLFEKHPLRPHFPPFAGFQEVESRSHYGVGYQDIQHRRPSIRNAERLLGWSPVVRLEDSVERTLDFFLRHAVESKGFQTRPVDGAQHPTRRAGNRNPRSS